MQVDAAIRPAGDGAVAHIADSQHLVPAPPDFTQTGQGVRGFTRLGNHEQQGALVEGSVAVPEFAGVLDFSRQVREFLEQIFANEAGVPARPRGRDHHAVYRAEFGGRQIQPAEPRHGGLVIEPVAQSTGDRVRLLENFLEHEVREAASLSRFRLEIEVSDRHGLRDLAEGRHSEAVVERSNDALHSLTSPKTEGAHLGGTSFVASLAWARGS